MDSDVRTQETGAPTDVGVPVTAGAATDTSLGAAERETLVAVADYLIPAAHGMPSAADVVDDDRIQFVLRSRPDLVQPLRAALRPDLAGAVEVRLAELADEPTNLAALQLVIVAAYYTDRDVKELIGYPGQMAIEVKSWLIPQYLEEGLIDAVLERGAVWRDPRTGERAVVHDAPRTYAERFKHTAGTAEGGS
jgi:hypothetical protein